MLLRFLALAVGKTCCLSGFFLKAQFPSRAGHWVFDPEKDARWRRHLSGLWGVCCLQVSVNLIFTAAFKVFLICLLDYSYISLDSICKRALKCYI
jgi:hypothetical protein